MGIYAGLTGSGTNGCRERSTLWLRRTEIVDLRRRCQLILHQLLLFGFVFEEVDALFAAHELLVVRLNGVAKVVYLRFLKRADMYRELRLLRLLEVLCRLHVILLTRGSRRLTVHRLVMLNQMEALRFLIDVRLLHSVEQVKLFVYLHFELGELGSLLL